MQVELTGRIVNVLPEQRFNGRNGEVVKNAFVIEWQDSGYKQLLCLEVVGADKFEKMKQSVAVGNTVQCKFSVSSREWNGKYFTTATCFYCANVGGQQQAQSPAQAPHQPANAPQQGNADDSGLPF
jgi:hypothetical protein